MSIEIITAPLVPDTAASIWFMAHWAPAGPWVLTAIVPDGGGVESAAFMPGQEDKMVAWINSRNATANIYFAVNPLLPSFTDPLLAGKSGKCVKAKKTDVAALAWIHADIDPRPISPGEDIDPQAWVRSEAARAIKRLYGFTPRPTALVYSGAGVQAFWRLAEPIPINGDPELAAAAEGYNLGMALALESDHVHNCDRIMRLSGTINWPDAKKRAKGRIPWRAATIEFFPDRAYPESDFTRAEVRKTVAASSGTAMVPAGSRTSTLPNGIDDLDRFMVDERTTTIILRAKLIITWGRDKEKPKAKDDSRSEWVFDVLCNLLRANVPDDLIHGTVTDPRFQISESVLKNPDDVWRRLEDAKAVVARDADPASPARAAGKPNGILMVAGELNAILDEAEDALLASGVPIYQRGELVRLSTVNVARAKKVPDVIKRAEGSTILTPVTDRWLLQQMARSISWSALNKKGDPVTADPKLIYASHLLARAGDWPFPVLKGLLSAPTLDRDGRIIQRPGYDAGSGLYLDFAPGLFPTIPEQPTLDEARTAMAKLENLLRGFPFDGAVSKSVALAAILTALIRPSIKTAPLHAFDAPAAGTGKSKIVELVGIIATGHTPAAMSQGKDDAEDEKRLSVSLREGDPIIWIDNCERPIQGDFLCSMLTQETMTARILGKSERVVLPSSTLAMATGNNLIIAGDASRRVVKSRLDAAMERPDTREFDFDCCVEARNNRAELVVAALTALRAYRLWGNPLALKPMGSFEEWSWVRGTFVATGYADPAGNRDEILADDPQRNELGDLMDAWDAVNGDRPVTVASMNIIREYTSSEDRPDPARLRLHTALVDASGQRQWNAKSIGWMLRRHKDRIFQGRRFVSEGDGQGMKWRLARTKLAVVAEVTGRPERLPGIDGN